MEAMAQAILTEIDLMDLLRDLHTKRQLLETANKDLRTLEEEFRAKNQGQYDFKASLQSDVTALENAVRQAALARYDKDPDKQKQICPGVGIRVSTEYDYDRDEAFAWAKNHGLCLSLDAKAFSDLCKAESTRPEFVRTVENRSATIATDLGKVLEAE